MKALSYSGVGRGTTYASQFDTYFPDITSFLEYSFVLHLTLRRIKKFSFRRNVQKMKTNSRVLQQKTLPNPQNHQKHYFFLYIITFSHFTKISFSITLKIIIKDNSQNSINIKFTTLSLINEWTDNKIHGF